MLQRVSGVLLGEYIGFWFCVVEAVLELLENQIPWYLVDLWILSIFLWQYMIEVWLEKIKKWSWAFHNLPTFDL